MHPLTWTAALAAILMTQVVSGQSVDNESAAGPKTVTLSARYTSHTVAGSGRFLAFHLADREEVAVVDLCEKRGVRSISSVPPDALVAGGASGLFVVQPAQNFVQRYDLRSFERTKVTPLVDQGPVKRVAMGPCSDGPLLMAGREARLFDAKTLQPLKIEGNVIGGSGQFGYELCVSADGQTFAGIPKGFGPVAYSLMRLDGHGTTIRSFGSTSHAVRWAQPTADARLILLPGGQLYTGPLEPQDATRFQGSTLFATVDPRYFLSVRFAVSGDGADVVEAAVCTVADLQVVYTIVGLEEMAPVGNTASRMSIAGRLHHGEIRYHYVPEARVLVTLPYDDKRVVIRDFDLLGELDANGNDYLFVDSLPPQRVRRGETLRYAIAAHSRRGTLKYELQAGPENMVVNRKGEVKWKVPVEFADETVAAIISIRDRRGREVLHSIRFAVTNN